MNAKTLFGEKLPRVLQDSPEKAKSFDAVYVLKISGSNGGVWTLDLKSTPPSVTADERADADCVVELTDNDFEALLADASVGMQMFMEGKIKISNPMLATKLVDLLTL